MRIDPLGFSEKNQATSQRPRVVVELSFDDANTDIYYITSHTIPGLTGNIIDRALVDVTSTSQKLNPDKALSTIGSISFKCLDEGLTDIQKTKLDAGLGLNGKRVRVHVGFAGDNWSDFVLVQTQIISDSISYKDMVFTFKCSDIQRAQRKKLFIVKETTLSATLTRDATTIEVENAVGFERVFQPPVGDSLAPSEEVGFIKISDGDAFEIIMWKGTPQATSFTQCVRGVFGTPKLEITKADGEEGAAVEEYVFISCPSLMLAYALQTGSFYGYPGKFLPDHWHLGISTDYIKTSDFVDHPDLWDINDIDAGIQATVEGAVNEDGKKFIEEQIYFMAGVYAPIAATGEITLKRLASIGTVGAVDRELNENNIVSYSELKEDLKSVINRIVLQWDYSVSRDIYRRTSVLIDQSSIDAHKVSNTKVIQLKTLYGSDDSLRIINNNFATLRSRYAAPPFRRTATLTPDQNDLELGDVVRWNLPGDRGTGRNYEIQSITTNWVTGDVSVGLFGSSGGASILTPDKTQAIDTTFLDYNVPIANHINIANFAGVTSSNGLTRITQNITLEGTDSLQDMNCVFYCDEDLQIDQGVTVTVKKNIQLRVNGYFTNNGTINGRGEGYPGGSATGATRNGVSGGVGQVGRQSKINVFLSGYHDDPHGKQTDSRTPKRAPSRSYRVSLPELNLSIRDNELKGLPSSLIGCSGDSGGGVYNLENSVSLIDDGADAGDSGAGLVIVSAGFNNGNSGFIDLSGTDGTLAPSTNWHGATVFAGSGEGGHNGGLLIVSTDSAQFTEFPSNGGTVLEIGASPKPSNANELSSTQKLHSGARYHADYYGTDRPVVNNYENFAKVIYLDASATFTDNTERQVETDPTFTLTEYLNTPATPEGDQSTIEVSVTPPADSNYSYSLVDYRNTLEDVWREADPASHESLIVVNSDGGTYEVRIRPVSDKGVISPTGPTQQITVTDINGKTDAELAVSHPFAAITGMGIHGEAGTEFSGLDANFVWDDVNGLLSYFNYYEVEIWSGAQLLRTETTVSPFYSYSYSKNLSDHLRINGARPEGVAGVFLSIAIKVRTVSKLYNSTPALYGSDQTELAVTASTVDDPDNLRFHQTARDALVADFASEVTQSDIDNLQDQIDGNITTWFYNGVPTLSNEPAVNWTNSSQRDAHIGDLYYDKDDHSAYRFKLISSVYQWESIPDSATTEALRLASTAQDTADNKRRVFTATPYTPYDSGDLWVDGTVVRVANSTRASTASYHISDWDVRANLTENTSDLNDDAGLGDTADWSGINDDDGNRPADGATADDLSTIGSSAGSVVYNPDFKIQGRDGRPAGVKAAYGTSNPSVVKYHDTLENVLELYSDTDTSIGCCLPAFRVQEGTTYTFIIRVKASSSDTAGFYFRMAELSSELTGGDTHVSGNEGESGVYTSSVANKTVLDVSSGQPMEDLPVSSSWQTYVAEYTPTPGTKWASPVFLNWISMDLRSLHIGKCYGTNNATAGAVWDDNLSGIPERLSDDATAGLNFTSTHLGFNFDGTPQGWRTYFNNSGHMYLNQGAGNNYLAWDGSTLTVRGNIHATSIDAAALSAITINAIDVTGGNITGSTIRTSTSGERIELDSATNELKAYWDDGGNVGAQKHLTIGNDGIDHYAIKIGTSGQTYHGGMKVDCHPDGLEAIYINEGGIYSRSTDIRPNLNAISWGNTSTIKVIGNASNKAAIDVANPSFIGVDAVGGTIGVLAYGEAAGVKGETNGTDAKGLVGEAPNGRGAEGRGGVYDFYANGSGTNYGPFTGAHDALLPQLQDNSHLYVEGDIAKVTAIVARSTLSNVLAEIQIQDQAEAKDSFGVLVSSRAIPEENDIASMSNLTDEEYQAFQSTHYIAAVNGVGEGQINVVDEGGDIEIGDFICTSNIPGKGKAYSGNDMRLVVARAIEPVTWNDEASNEKKIACIYMCG